MADYELKSLALSDYSAVSSWLADREDMVKVCADLFEYPLSKAAFSNYFIDNAGKERGRLCYKFVASGSGDPVGMISFNTIEWQNHYGHIGLVVVDPQLRGSGIGEKMVRFLIAKGFNEHGFHRIDLAVIEENKAAYRFYVDRIGFKDEGLMRERVRVEEEYISWYCLSILADEWQLTGAVKH